MKHLPSTEQLSLFTITPVENFKIVTDPYWDEIVKEQVTSATIPHPVEPLVGGQAICDPAWDEPIHTCEVVGEQVTEISLESANTNTLVKFHTQKSAPQHDNHWVEKYWVERSGNKYWYYRYMWMSGRKIHRLYIGSVDSPKAKQKKQAVEDAIADGQTPIEIKQVIRSWR